MLCLVRCSGLAFWPASLCFLFILFIYFFDKQTGKRKDKGGRLHKDSPIMCSFSQSIWSLGEGKGEFFKFCFFLFMTDLGLDKRRSSVTLMFMYTQIVSSWVLSGNRVHVKAKLWAGDCYFKPLPSWNTWVYFSLYWFYVCRKKNEREPSFASFSFQWIERRGRKRTILLKVFFLTRVTNIAFLDFFFLRRKIRKTHTHTQEEKINKCFSFILHVLNYAEE